VEDGIEDMDGVLTITKIRLRYRFKIPPGTREKVDRVLASYAEKCPAVQRRAAPPCLGICAAGRLLPGRPARTVRGAAAEVGPSAAPAPGDEPRASAEDISVYGGGSRCFRIDPIWDHPTKAYLASWMARILSLKNSWSRKPSACRRDAVVTVLRPSLPTLLTLPRPCP
jgi:hypothetical protein